MANKKKKPIGKSLNVTTSIDDTGHAEAMIRKALTPELHTKLMTETREMLDAGATIEEIFWLLTGNGEGFADRRSDSLEFLRGNHPELVDVVAALPDARPGKMIVAYMGPEGVFVQHWSSAVTSNAKA